MMCPAILADNAKGNRMGSTRLRELSDRTGLRRVENLRGRFAGQGRFGGPLRFGFQQARQQEGGRRDAMARIDPAASGGKGQQGGAGDQTARFPVNFHSVRSINRAYMLATTNCAWPRTRTARFVARCHGVLTLAAAIGCAALVHGGTATMGSRDLAARAAERFVEAQEKHRAQPANTEAAWQFARAAFELAEFSTNHVQRAVIAQQGIQACREVLARGVREAPVHHYLAMNLGQLARTRSLGALRIVDEMEREFKMARALDEHLDHAGPDRNLGLLYLEAPRIGSIGNRSKARQHLLRAVELAPDFPENRLSFAEACLRWTDFHLARRELKALEELWPAARAKFSGQDWEASWMEWESRLERLREDLAEHPRREGSRGKD